MAFIETPRFPDNIAYNALGGASFSTDVVVLGSGFEQRNINWDLARGRWDISHGVKRRDEMNTIIAFHRAMKGRAHGFRFKDWTDYQLTVENGMLDEIETLPGTYQIKKKYVAGSLIDYRFITKPVTGTFFAYRDNVAIAAGVGAGQYAIDYTTGVVTIKPDLQKTINANSSKTILGISKASPGVVNAAAHGFITGDKIKLINVGGMVEVNNLYFTITFVDVDHFSIGVNTSAYTTFTSGGSAVKYGITQTNPVRVYSNSHGRLDGETVVLQDVLGMTEINNINYEVVNASTDYFDLFSLDGTAYAARTTGGLISVYAQPDEVLTCACEFDVPVRFDDDRLPVAYVYKNVLQVDQIPIIEIRV